MLIVANRSILLPSADGSRAFPVARGFVGEIPEWAACTPYFAALVADGKISVPHSPADRDVVAEAEKPKPRKAKND